MSNKTLHIRIAEQGKLFSLDGNYGEALRHYKEAMRMVQQQEESDIFFQHYSQCTMETLELSESYDEVISFCEKYINFLDNKEDNAITKKHKAFVLQRQAVQHLLKGENEEAGQLLTVAQQLIGKGKQPLSDELLSWVQRGYTVKKDQIQKLQQKHQYFIVRKDQVNEKLAMPLPENLKQI